MDVLHWLLPEHSKDDREPWPCIFWLQGWVRRSTTSGMSNCNSATHILLTVLALCILTWKKHHANVLDPVTALMSSNMFQRHYLCCPSENLLLLILFKSTITISLVNDLQHADQFISMRNWLIHYPHFIIMIWYSVVSQP